jgi:hypothetical protein
MFQRGLSGTKNGGILSIHASLADSLRRQESPSPEDWEATFRNMALFDLAADVELGFFLSYYRNFAIPSIAATLHANGEIQQRPMKRSYDTAIVIYELIATGLDSDRGREMISLLNHVHRNVPGSKDDFLYVLLTLLVVPIRWTQEHAWRQPTTAELAAASRFFTELGSRMNIHRIPATYAEAEQFFDGYEATHVAPSPEGQQLMDATVQVFQGRLPRPLRPFARQIISAMLDHSLPLRLAQGAGPWAGIQWIDAGRAAGAYGNDLAANCVGNGDPFTLGIGGDRCLPPKRYGSSHQRFTAHGLPGPHRANDNDGRAADNALVVEDPWIVGKRSRAEDICADVSPFMAQSGFGDKWVGRRESHGGGAVRCRPEAVRTAQGIWLSAPPVAAALRPVQSGTEVLPQGLKQSGSAFGLDLESGSFVVASPLGA